MGTLSGKYILIHLNSLTVNNDNNGGREGTWILLVKTANTQNKTGKFISTAWCEHNTLDTVLLAIAREGL